MVAVSNNTEVSASRCSWDDGYSAPPVPTYDSQTKTCHNVVLDVYYNFTWQDARILQLNATLILADIPMETITEESVTIEYENITIVNGTEEVTLIEKTINTTVVNTNSLTQKFKVEFFPLYIMPNESDYNITDNVTDFFTTERYQRSGNPGTVISV